MSKNESKPLSRKLNIVVQDYGSEILIYDLTINKAFSLNETSAMVWQACDGNKTVSEITAQISRQLKSPIREDFVWLALEQLKKEKLIGNDAEIPAQFEGLTRREIIRKVGLASLITLPIVSALVAPTAAHAQSGCGAASGRPNGCTCSGGANCASGCCGRTEVSTNQCVAQPGTDPTGSVCRAGCECASGICTGAPLRCA